MPSRLNESELSAVLTDWPANLAELARHLREMILSEHPQLDERVAFGALSYSKPHAPYGVIGGNVCLIDHRPGADHITLAFLHGASLCDPQHQLRGTAKAKRHIELRDLDDVDLAAVNTLIAAAIAHDPADGG